MPHSTMALVTGAGSGLGRALAQKLADCGFTVLITGRRPDKLAETCQYAPEKILAIPADISTPQGRQKIADKLHHLNKPLRFLIHNAAIVTPIAPLKDITLADWRQIQATNVEAPLFLTQLLWPFLEKSGDARILHISSDCAQYPLANWIPYCTSKAALQMIYRCLQKEISASTSTVSIGSVDPGMMYTPMQDYICREEIQFPEKMPLAQLEREHLIFTPEFSADFCIKLLLEYSPEDFSKGEHGIYH